MIMLKILKWENFPGLPGGQKIITGALQGEQGESRRIRDRKRRYDDKNRGSMSEKFEGITSQRK